MPKMDLHIFLQVHFCFNPSSKTNDDDLWTLLSVLAALSQSHLNHFVQVILLVTKNVSCREQEPRECTIGCTQLLFQLLCGSPDWCRIFEHAKNSRVPSRLNSSALRGYLSTIRFKRHFFPFCARKIKPFMQGPVSLYQIVHDIRKIRTI